jgi:hypothetical protein
MKQLRCGVLIALLWAAVALPLSATTWFVRADGGTRASSATTTGQCDGRADAAYPGSGKSQHCAFNDVRYLWMNGAYGNSAWVISGGDTVVIRGCAALPSQQHPDAPHCRIGWDKGTGNDAQNFWCAGVNAFWGCSMPPPPSGTAAKHTRILGGCAYGTYSCNPVISYPYTSNNLTQLFGGFQVGAVMHLEGAQYVDIEGLEITSHNGACTRIGGSGQQYPKPCSTSPPLSDYANWGILTNNATSNILLQDLYIHGFTNFGIGGPIGGPITVTRVSIDFNAFAAWNFDDGKPTPNGPGSSINASHVTMEGSGCLEEYPIVHPQFPALSCWDTNSGGFGDSWSGQDAKLDSLVCDHCVMAYNTKDGFIGPHTLVSYLKITNSESYGNMGQQWKWGSPPGSTTIFENNLTVGNCRRMSEPMPGAPAGYNRYLSGFCRAAGDVFSFFTAPHSTVLFANNTTVGYSATMFDLSCGQQKACDSTSFIFRNNIVLGYTNPRNNPSEAPSLFYYSDPSVKLTLDHDIFFNLRSKPCPSFGRSDLICDSPAFVNQPKLSIAGEAQLDHFNFHPSSSSPANGHGAAISGITTDYYGAVRPSPPSIGAVEPSR